MSFDSLTFNEALEIAAESVHTKPERCAVIVQIRKAEAGGSRWNVLDRDLLSIIKVEQRGIRIRIGIGIGVGIGRKMS